MRRRALSTGFCVVVALIACGADLVTVDAPTAPAPAKAALAKVCNARGKPAGCVPPPPDTTPTPPPPPDTTPPPPPPPPDTTPAPTGIAIFPGESFQAKSDAAPADATFIVKAGRHVRQSVKPKDGQTFIGEPGAVMDGEGVTPFAFRAWNDARWVNRVTIKQLAITRYAPPAQNGAIWGGDDETNAGSDWVLDSLDVGYSGNLAVRIGNRMQVLRSRLHHSGTINIGGIGKGVVVDGVESTYGNAGCAHDPGFESGGSKFVRTDSLVVRNSTFSDNCGVGLWLDINNIHYDLYGNTVERNVREGIAVEISYRGQIHHNTLVGNGLPNDTYRPNGWCWDAAIGVHASSDVEVYSNTLTENFNGIMAIQQRRGAAYGDPAEQYGPYLVQNLWVHDNVVTQRNPQAAGLENSVGGICDDTDQANGGAFNRNNRWDRNTYYTAGRAYPFTWLNGWKSWTYWQSTAGQDLAGSNNP